MTPSIEGRERFRIECRQSVAAQTYRDFEHLVVVDSAREGCAVTMNRLAREASGEWLVPLADDDLLLPGALDTLLRHSQMADVVYSPPLVWGNGDTHFFGTPPQIPSFALIRASLWEELEGYDESRIREEDRDLWTRALNVGARFIRADSEPTWVYRFHKGNKSYHRGVSS
jgi:glycosyltransferase involved in cell wall biosynthesis